MHAKWVQAWMQSQTDAKQAKWLNIFFWGGGGGILREVFVNRSIQRTPCDFSALRWIAVGDLRLKIPRLKARWKSSTVSHDDCGYYEERGGRDKMRGVGVRKSFPIMKCQNQKLFWHILSSTMTFWSQAETRVKRYDKSPANSGFPCIWVFSAHGDNCCWAIPHSHISCAWCADMYIQYP